MDAPLARIAEALASLSRRVVPDAFPIACGLTVLTFLLGMAIGGASPSECLAAWGGSIWALSTFGMQICLVVFSGTLVASSPPALAALRRVAAVPRSPRQAVALVAVVSMVLCWVHWGMGLVASATLVGVVAERQPRTDYRLLVASAYLGMGTTWHAGPSGTVPLLLATPDNFLVKDGFLAGTIPLAQTIFTPLNLGFCLVTVVALGALAPLLHPAPGRERAIDPQDARRIVELPAIAPREPTIASAIDHSRLPNAIVGGAALVWFAVRLAQGAAFDLDWLNLAFLGLAVLLHGCPASLAAAAPQAARPLHGVVLQFPLYAGMFGILKDTGLAAWLAEAFATAASPGSLPAVVLAYSAVLNYFVPSGGSKWAIEAPYLLAASARLGVPVPTLAMSYAVGDMSTNLIQPFWAIPLLSVARIGFGEILGYLVLFFGAYALLGIGYVLLLG